VTAARPGSLRLATKVAALLLAATAAIAIAVHLLAPARARATLGYGFGGVPHTLGTATGILVNNARVLAAILAASIAVQAGRELADSALARAFVKALVLVCDSALLLFSSANVLLIGAAYGAYGLRTLRATAAHGPFELAAFSIGLALYLVARREPLAARPFAAGAGAAFALLMIGAIVEAYA
jgi:hypothetical protein